MTIFGIDEADSLVASLAEFDSAAEATDLFARAAWSGIAEPGDRVALAAIRQLGTANSLRALIGKRDAQWWAAVLEPQFVSPDDASKALARWQPRASASAVVQSLRQAERCGARLVVPGSAHWPSALDDLGDHSPIAIWVRGSAAALDSTRRSVALVGARAASGYGEHITMEASAGLVDRGFAIVSGAAYGIDGMAHRAALASKGQTIAFLAGGVDRFYPSGHDTLLSQIAAEGAVVAELPCGSSPTKWRFLQRKAVSTSLRSECQVTTPLRPMLCRSRPLCSPRRSKSHRPKLQRRRRAPTLHRSRPLRRYLWRPCSWRRSRRSKCCSGQ